MEVQKNKKLVKNIKTLGITKQLINSFSDHIDKFKEINNDFIIAQDIFRKDSNISLSLPESYSKNDLTETANFISDYLKNKNSLSLQNFNFEISDNLVFDLINAPKKLIPSGSEILKGKESMESINYFLATINNEKYLLKEYINASFKPTNEIDAEHIDYEKIDHLDNYILKETNYSLMLVAQGEKEGVLPLFRIDSGHGEEFAAGHPNKVEIDELGRIRALPSHSIITDNHFHVYHNDFSLICPSQSSSPDVEKIANINHHNLKEYLKNSQSIDGKFSFTEYANYFRENIEFTHPRLKTSTDYLASFSDEKRTEKDLTEEESFER